VTNDLQNFISKCNDSWFAISSRPEQALTAFSDFQEFGIQELEMEDAFELIRKLDNYQDRSIRLIEQIERQVLVDMDDFLGNPLLVSLLYKKFEYRESIPFKKQEFFYEVFEALFQAHDLSKGGSYVREKESKLSLSDFFQILRGVGYRCIQKGIQFNEAQLMDIIEQVKGDFAREFDSFLFLNDLTKAVPLFVRDGLTIRWAHKSIQQYFAAEYICRDSKHNQEKILLALYRSPKVEFYEFILALCYEIDYKSFRSSIIYSFCKEWINIADNSLSNIAKAGKVSNKDINIRRGLMYETGMGLIKDATNLNDAAKNEMEKKWGTSLYVEISGSPDGYLLCAPNNSFSVFSLIRLLYVFNNELIDPLTDKYPLSGDISLPENFPMKSGELFFLDNDEPGHVLNNPENFSYLNNVLLYSNILVDYEKVNQMIALIEKEKEMQSYGDFIAGF
jgi:hypothetical protein